MKVCILRSAVLMFSSFAFVVPQLTAAPLEGSVIKPPIHFVVQDSSSPKKKMADDSTYLIVDEMPTYPGGQPAMMKFLSKNVKYPRYAVEKGISGTVYVKFDISADGSISNVQSVNKTVGVLEEEAIRVVNKMPKWNPGKEKGEAVRVKYTLPVSFTMSIR